MRKILTLLLFFYCELSLMVTSADPLPLTEHQLERLQQYFSPTRKTDKETENFTHHVWQGNPIVIELLLHQEKRLVFTEPVTVDAQGTLTTEQLRLLNNNQSLYLTALQAFPVTRLNVTLMNSHQVIFLDVLTTPHALSQTEYINEGAATPDEINTHLIKNNTDEIHSSNDSDVYITLLRNAWQQLYAPKRLLTDQVLTRVPMHTQFFTPYLLYGDKAYVHPLISWVYQHTYITAVELRNKYPLPEKINVSRDICGNWLTATLYPTHLLKPVGNKTGDTTLLLLISAKPFAESVEHCHAPNQ